MANRILITAIILVAGVNIDPPVHSVSMNATLHIRLNGAVTDWLLGAIVAPSGATAKVQVFEIDRDFKDARSKMNGQGFAKSVSYPAVTVVAGTVQVNGIGSHDTTSVYLEAPAWTNMVVTGPNEEMLYQTFLRKPLLVSRGVEFEGAAGQNFRMVLPWSDRTHEARVRLLPPATRFILQTRL